jgi:putative peptidoglycan lipid II flippase
MSAARDTEPSPAHRLPLARTALRLLPIQILFRGGEALWPLLLAAWFGRSPATDTYFLCAALYVFAGSLITGAFQDSALVPVLLEVEAREPSAMPRVAGAVLGHTFAIAGALSVVLGGVAAVGFAWTRSGPSLRLALVLVALYSLWLVAVAARAFFVGLLNAHRRFTAHPVAAGAGMAVTIGVVAALKGPLGVAVVPLALLVGEGLSALLLVRFARTALGLTLRPSLERPDPVPRLFSLLGFEVVGNTVTRINPVVDQLMAGLSPLLGAGTVLRYAMEVASLPNSVMQAALYPVLLSRFSLEGTAPDRAAFRRTLRQALLWVVLLLVVVSALLICFRAPVFRLLFLRGEMDAAGVARMAEVAPYALAGVPSFGALLVLARAHVALQNGRIMLPVGVLNAALNALLNLALFPFLGLAGIALATSLVHTAVALVLGWRIRPLLAGSEQ